MSLLDRIFAEPELREFPPVLVDVGAAGGVHPAWRRIARYAVGVGFEPDAREAAPLGAAQREFRQWIFCPGLAVPESPAGGQATLHLTRSPQCSSTLPPRTAALAEWAFAEFFEVIETRACAATTLETALRAQGVGRIDWLKCDTQGTDLRLYRSLSPVWRKGLGAVEFEPGLIDAYEGEDGAADVLALMAREPYWLAEIVVGRTPRGRRELVARHFGGDAMKWYRRLAPSAPGWVNLRFLRRVDDGIERPDRRGVLLAWVFATITSQHGQALLVAETGGQQFGGELFDAMARASRRSLWWAMAGALPGLGWRRLWRSAG